MYKLFSGKIGLNKMLALFDRNTINMLPKIIQLTRKYFKEIWK